MSQSTRSFCCEKMEAAVADPDVPIIYIAKFNEFGVRVLDGGSSYLELLYCPWSGQKLPESLRSEWFSELERLGIDPYGETVPAEFSDERWYQKRDDAGLSATKPTVTTGE